MRAFANRTASLTIRSVRRFVVFAVACLIACNSTSADDTAVLPRSSVLAESISVPNWIDLCDGCNWHDQLCLVGSLSDPDAAVLVEPVYYADLLTNTRGGLADSSATRYEGLLDLAVTIDLDKLECKLPGTLYLLGQTTHGRGLTDDIVGDSLVLSDIDAGENITQLGAFWWEVDAFDERLTLRIGKQDLNTEFFYMDTAEYFVQSSFELTPKLGLPTYPQQSLAAAAYIQIDPSTRLKLGIWDAVAPTETWGFSGNDTIFVAAELERHYTLGHGLEGVLAIAGGYLSEGSIDGALFDSVYSLAFQWEQQLYREAGCDPHRPQGLAMFAAYYPRFFEMPRLPESIGDTAVAGLVYTGLFAGRDEDHFGVGVSWGQLFQGGSNQETACEVFYRAQLTPRVSLQPDLQYIATPSGIHPDALVVGLRLQVDL